MINKNYLKMFLAMIFWGASFVFIKIVFEYVGPVTMILFRLIIASSILFIIDKFWFKSRIEKSDYSTFFLLGFTEPFLYFIGEGYGLQYVTSTQASVIIATIPVFAMLFSIVLYKERVGKVNVTGVLISFAGVLTMIGIRGLLDKGQLIGILLMFLAVFAAVFNSLVLVKLGKKYSSFTIITYQNIVGCILFLPLFFILEVGDLSIEIVTMRLILSLMFLAIFPSVISFLLYISTLKRIGVTKTSVFSNMIPIITGILSFLLLGDNLTLREIVGIGIVILGLFLSQKKHPHPVLHD